LLTSSDRIVGLPDGPTNGETDDIVTSYAYTTHSVTTDPPAGLVASVTDPLGHVTA
jgi:hypothetical protein